MIGKFNRRETAVVMKNKFLFIALLAAGTLLHSTIGAQTPSPSPSGTTANVGGYEISTSVELGLRGVQVNGNEDKFRSDFNYRPGFRVFDSSFSMERKDGSSGGFFDSLQFASSGWDADPSGFLRVSIEKFGAYRFDSNYRRVHYFNRLNNHINSGGQEPGWKGGDTVRNYGDFDLTLLPQNEKVRFRFGVSYYRISGTAGFTTRPFSDEFPVTRNVDLDSTDFRGGVDAKLAGFKFSFTGGFRHFNDESVFTLPAPHPGLTTTNNARLTAFSRIYPIEGNMTYAMLSAQRTFAQKLDFTGRFVYSYTKRNFKIREEAFGFDNSNNFFSPDRYAFDGESNRPQTRGDVGLTYRVTEKFRISNTFTFDLFEISGDSRLAQETISFSPTGAARPTSFTNTFWNRINDFKRFTNTVEADYQFNRRFGINVGYRFTHRTIEIGGINQPLPPSTSAPTPIEEENENSTSTLLIATRYKPFNNWSIFADLEHGESDNAFTRLSNYNFTNFRVRSNANYKQFTFNLSLISRNNENPSSTSAIGTTVPAGELVADINNLIFSGYVDWSPDPRFSVSTGYTYQHLTSKTDIIVPLAALTPGFSEFYIRDNYAFVDVTAQPVKWVSVFASYRFDKDNGQGDRVSTAPQFIVSSYPYSLKLPEIRLAFRLTKNIDWNVGYQYYDYQEQLQNSYFAPIPPNQNYNAHLPYTSLRIFFGGARDR